MDHAACRNGQVSTSAVETLVSSVLMDMEARWQNGERPAAEQYFARHPELTGDPEAALRVIYEELCLREEAGEAVAPETLFRRFPEWHSQLERLLSCHRLLGSEHAPGPAAVDLDDYTVVAELGRGAQGQVYLATQRSLADRPVVLKITTLRGREHLALARLQHTHIVPLYAAQDDTQSGRRVLCMPYFGGATLRDILARLADTPVRRRSGRDIVAALDHFQGRAPVPVPSAGPVRQALAGDTYEQAVCHIGAALARGLHYAHERGLVHLDVKPANILLAADGQPMLLDFHIAQRPLPEDAAPSEGFGATPLYMSPEQCLALQALEFGVPAPKAVDGRSDIYSLGVVLYEALGGALDTGAGADAFRPRLDTLPVPTGLRDILAKCLARSAAVRYPRADLLAEDLDRHAHDLPLRGAPNRSWAERWRKWRRRRPYDLPLCAVTLTLLAALVWGGLSVLAYLGERHRAADKAFADGRDQMAKGDYAGAVLNLRAAGDLAEGLPVRREWTPALGRHLSLARRGAKVQELRGFVAMLRFHTVLDDIPRRRGLVLAAGCANLWATRAALLDRGAGDLPLRLEQDLQTDLLDLAILWGELRARLAPPEGRAAAHREALRVLAEAERLFGLNPVLAHQQLAHRRALGEGPGGPATVRASEGPSRNAWEHAALGRQYLQAGRLEDAARQLRRAVDLDPLGFHAHFYRGVCAYRQKQYDEAVAEFQFCLGQSPTADCFFCRGLALLARGDAARAGRDFDRAVASDETLGLAFLHRGKLHCRGKRFGLALADLGRALALGTDPPDTHYHLALTHHGLGDLPRARTHVRQALSHDPGHGPARELAGKLAPAS